LLWSSALALPDINSMRWPLLAFLLVQEHNQELLTHITAAIPLVGDGRNLHVKLLITTCCWTAE